MNLNRGNVSCASCVSVKIVKDAGVSCDVSGPRSVRTIGCSRKRHRRLAAADGQFDGDG